MKYLLISPPKRAVKMFTESPPIGLGYLATAIRKLGHKVSIIDCLVDNYDVEETIKIVNTFDPDIVGINVFSTAITEVQEIVEGIKWGKTPRMVILGGPHITGSPETTFKYFPQADYAFRGEAEIGIEQFDEYLQGRRHISDVAGLVYKKTAQPCYDMNAPVEHQNIEELGYPAWDLIDPRKYFKHVLVGDKSIPLHFTRGCPYGCRFCVKLGTKLRTRSINHIWEELEYLNKEFGVERFIINDEGYTMDKQMVKDFCRHTISKGNKFSYFAQSGLRLNRLDDEMLELMKEARHEPVFGVGIESAVPRVRQELMNKKLTQEEMVTGLEMLKKHGFKPVGNFILGFPGDTRKELIQSMKWLFWAYDQKLLHGAIIIPFLPLPGSEATNDLMKSGELSKDYDFSKINLTKVVYAPKGMTIKELDNIRKWAVWKLNTRPRLIWRYVTEWGRFKRAVLMFMRIFMPNWLVPMNWRRA